MRVEGRDHSGDGAFDQRVVVDGLDVAVSTCTRARARMDSFAKGEASPSGAGGAQAQARASETREQGEDAGPKRHVRRGHA